MMTLTAITSPKFHVSNQFMEMVSNVHRTTPFYSTRDKGNKRSRKHNFILLF